MSCVRACRCKVSVCVFIACHNNEHIFHGEKATDRRMIRDVFQRAFAFCSSQRQSPSGNHFRLAHAHAQLMMIFLVFPYILAASCYRAYVHGESKNIPIALRAILDCWCPSGSPLLASLEISSTLAPLDVTLCGLQLEYMPQINLF